MQSRKEFLKNLGTITLGACCGGMLLSLEGCASVSQVSGNVNNNRLVVDKTQLEGKSSVIVNHSSLRAPVFLHKMGEDQYSAVLMLCTHKQCELTPAGSILNCPCHGSEFSKEGKVLEGPAETDLEKYKVTVEGNNIEIKL